MMRMPFFLSVLLVLLLNGCSDPEPLRIGFIGGLSGRVADLGLAGRNGVTLAFEEANQAGGINGRKVELLLADDRQDPQTARHEVQKLIDQGVVAIIGPMTSVIATATVALANDNKIPLLSPTVTTEELTGIDDYFLRVASGTDQYSSAVARYLFNKRGLQKVAVAYDLRNSSYTESWLGGFRKEFEKLGGQLIILQPFQSSPDQLFSALAEGLLQQPSDAVISIASAMDTAMLSQQLRKLGYDKTIAGPAWSATEKLIEMGGQAVEGAIFAQFFDRESNQPTYVAFRDRYRKRFIEAPGFASVAGYDAAQVLLQALDQGKEKDLKESILKLGRFSGLQGEVSIDRYGDARRPTFITRVHAGNFSVQE